MGYPRVRRPPIDRDSRRHFVYRVHDGSGLAVYVGRSVNPRTRLAEHHWTLSHPNIPDEKKPTWLPLGRSISMLGPFTYDDAVTIERMQIELHQPRGNRDLTLASGHRPKYVALRVAEAAAALQAAS